LLVVGHGKNNRIQSLKYDVVNLGFVTYETLAMAFQSADVFVCPTIEDSGPVMVIQSMLCGTPVVGFKMGVNIDLIENNKTGYIAMLKNVNDLANGIQEFLFLPPSVQNNISEMCLAKSKLASSSFFYENLNRIITTEAL
jgi:glycosyltransferase involved in cell wall biosynthesis